MDIETETGNCGLDVPPFLPDSHQVHSEIPSWKLLRKSWTHCSNGFDDQSVMKMSSIFEIARTPDGYAQSSASQRPIASAILFVKRRAVKFRFQQKRCGHASAIISSLFGQSVPPSLPPRLQIPRRKLQKRRPVRQIVSQLRNDWIEADVKNNRKGWEGSGINPNRR